MKRYIEILSDHGQKFIINIDRVSYVACCPDEFGKDQAIFVFKEDQESITTQCSYEEIKKYFGLDEITHRCW